MPGVDVPQPVRTEVEHGQHHGHKKVRCGMVSQLRVHGVSDRLR
jgi:hypothetical protein